MIIVSHQMVFFHMGWGGGGWNWPSSVLRGQSEFKLEWGVEEIEMKFFRTKIRDPP